MSRASFGKPLKGVGTLSSRFTGSIEDAIFDAISSGGIPLENVEITGGTIDGVVIGSNQPGPGQFTTLYSGSPSGQGFEVCFYGQTVGDSACWEPVIGRWNIQGDVIVRDISDLGNLRVSSNTISSTNTNGNIVLDPDGVGVISILGPITHTTSTGDITLNTDNGFYTLSTSDSIVSTSGTRTDIKTTNGDITLNTGVNIPTNTISAITTGILPTITTIVGHGLEVGDTITITSSNSVPNINGEFSIVTVPTTTTFTISVPVAITVSGNTGAILKHNDINLTAKNNINIPSDVGLTFSKDSINIKSDGVDLSVNTGTGSLNINGDTIITGDLTITGTTTKVESTVVSIIDPVFTLGGDTPLTVDDNKDRGIEFRWHNGTTDKLGFFGFDDSTGCLTFIPDAINTGEIFTGVPGCVDIGSLKVKDSIETCNITCASTMTLTSPNIVIETDNLSIDDPIIRIGENTVDDNKDRGVEFKWNDSGDVKTGFFGMDDSTGCFTYIPDAVNTMEVISGVAGCAKFGDMTVDNLTVNGTLSTSGGIYTSEYLTSVGGGVINPTSTINLTFISITSVGITTGTLPSASPEGFPKMIIVYSLVSGAEYRLTTPSGIFLDPGSGTTGSKTIRFYYAGQSIHLIWLNTPGFYVAANGGACIS